MANVVNYIITLVFLVVLLKNVEGRRFERCSMARELLKNGFPRNELSSWVCLAKAESSFDTHAVNKANPDASQDWGLFQINDMHWCNPPPRAGFKPLKNGCKIHCSNLLSDDIAVAAKCAQYIKKKKGFEAWDSWNSECMGKYIDLSDCGLDIMFNTFRTSEMPPLPGLGLGFFVLNPIGSIFYGSAQRTFRRF